MGDSDRGVMAGVRRYECSLVPFLPDVEALHFICRCTCLDCDEQSICCYPDEDTVQIV